MKTIKVLTTEQRAILDIHNKVRHYEAQKTVTEHSSGLLEHESYVIELKTGVCLYPKTRARFSKLCHQRLKQIKTAFVRLNPGTDPDDIYMLIYGGKLV